MWYVVNNTTHEVLQETSSLQVAEMQARLRNVNPKTRGQIIISNTTEFANAGKGCL